jgi:hypothetical protein
MSDEPVYEVVAPVTARRVEGLEAARPLPGLGNMRIAVLWDSLFHGDVCLEAVAAEVVKKYEGTVFVGYAEFGDFHGRNEEAVLAELPGRLERYRIDAAVIGVGS